MVTTPHDLLQMVMTWQQEEPEGSVDAGRRRSGPKPGWDEVHINPMTGGLGRVRGWPRKRGLAMYDDAH
jgi:hypothetical protein